jgi:hypothetical protein
VRPLFVVVSAEVLVGVGGLGQQGVDDGEHRVAGGGQGFFLDIRQVSRRYFAARKERPTLLAA